MGALYLILSILDLIVCFLFGVQATLATTDFRIGSSIFCAICWGVCFILNLSMAIDKFRNE